VPGRYHSLIGFEGGQQLELVAEWRGKRITARTRKPYPARIDTVTVRVDASVVPPELVWEGTYLPTSEEAYGAGIRIYSQDSVIGYAGEGTLARITDAAPDGRIHLVGRFPWHGVLPDSATLGVMSYDQPYYDYQISRGYANPPPTSLFSGSIRSNVRGDGVGVVWASTFSARTFRFR
jgi:hypothetical protein